MEYEFDESKLQIRDMYLDKDDLQSIIELLDRVTVGGANERPMDEFEDLFSQFVTWFIARSREDDLKSLWGE